jgi:hypothetical protein
MGGYVPEIPDCMIASDVTTADGEEKSGVKVDATDGEAWSMFTLTTRGDALVGQAGGNTLADPAVCRLCSLGLHVHAQVVEMELFFSWYVQTYAMRVCTPHDAQRMSTTSTGLYSSYCPPGIISLPLSSTPFRYS